jgi:hypothetical protein
MFKVKGLEKRLMSDIYSIEKDIETTPEKNERNLLIEMERTFEGTEKNALTSPSPQNVYEKLHTEIKQFKSGISKIMKEMQPVKNLIIQKITELI